MNKKTARHHHYVSQCYLKGFTPGGSKKSKLTVIDFKERKTFETNIRNVCGIRDFNRIEVEGEEPDVLEKELSLFEGQLTSALLNLEDTQTFDGENKDLILNFIALLAVRSPQMREHLSKFQSKILDTAMGLLLATKERWESHIEKIKQGGIDINEKITYKDMKEFFERKKYTIKIPREQHLLTELLSANNILPCLFHRNWLLIKATKESGPFITTDNPVNLTWKNPYEIPPFYRNNPGYGLIDTQVYFPISRNLAIIGEFNGHEGVLDGTKELVAARNSKMLIFKFKQIYSPTINFYFMGKKDNILEGTQIFKHIIT